MTTQPEKDGESTNSSARDSLLKQRLRQRGRHGEHTDKPATAAPVPDQPVGLSPYQRPLWVDYQMYPERRTAWIVRGYRLDGVIDEDRLADALLRLRDRHWYLTCAIRSDGKVHPRDAEIPLEVIAVTDDPWKKAQRYCRTRLAPFRLEQGELFRIHLFQNESQSAVVFAIHHILADLQGLDALVAELSALFEGNHADTLPPADLILAYDQQRSALDDKRPELQDFWKAYLDKLPAAAPLPLAKRREIPLKRDGRLMRIEVDRELAKRCRAASAHAGVSSYQWFLAAWFVLLSKYYGRSDIHLGTVLSTRTGGQQRNAVGYFQNVLVLRTDLEDTSTFADVLDKTRSVVGSAIANRGLPLDELARLAPARSAGQPLFSTLFTMVTANNQPRLFQRNIVKSEELDYAGTAFDLTFFVISSGDNLSFAAEFDTAVYDSESVTALFEHYQTLLGRLVTDGEVDWWRCSLVADKTLNELSETWRRIGAESPPGQRLHDAFYRQAAAHPDVVALQWHTADGRDQMSYQELASRADAIAGFIDAQAAADDTKVAVIGGWQPDTVAALIGILRSGRAYLPVDADYPTARIEYILNDAGRPLVLLQQGASAPRGFEEQSYSIAEAIDTRRAPGTPSVDQDISYIIYTSGSSGAPKGVQVSHAAAVYSTYERSRVYTDWPPEIFLLLSSFAFDSAVAGLWWSLSTGACVRLVERQTARAADEIAELIARESITHTLCLPSQWSDICRISDKPLDSMRLVVVAGESCSAKTVERHFASSPGAALYNEYGPTEMTVWSTFHQLRRDAEDPVPIGRPLALTQALVIDAHGNPVPEGLTGELVLAGHGVAEGYVGEVNDGFIAHPLDAESRAYRTGDRARVGFDGLLYYLGRVDEQVKFRGFRIGIESIEQAIGQAGEEVAVIPWDGLSLEDMVAKLPAEKAHALIDRYLSRKT